MEIWRNQRNGSIYFLPLVDTTKLRHGACTYLHTLYDLVRDVCAFILVMRSKYIIHSLFLLFLDFLPVFLSSRRFRENVRHRRFISYIFKKSSFCLFLHQLSTVHATCLRLYIVRDLIIKSGRFISLVVLLWQMPLVSVK